MRSAEKTLALMNGGHTVNPTARLIFQQNPPGDATSSFYYRHHAAAVLEAVRGYMRGKRPKSRETAPPCAPLSGCCTITHGLAACCEAASSPGTTIGPSPTRESIRARGAPARTARTSRGAALGVHPPTNAVQGGSDSPSREIVRKRAAFPALRSAAAPQRAGGFVSIGPSALQPASQPIGGRNHGTE